MKVNEAVRMAVTHVSSLFEHEKLTNIGLEEVEYDPEHHEWTVTVGFSRPWDYPTSTTTIAALAYQSEPPKRSYKIIRINDDNQEIVAMKNYSMA
ncbi:MAG: hypothetical protein HZB29_09620 [Nitrospinae bacterium]|nr:hypothetical protein [Nitrospinota bacterium]